MPSEKRNVIYEIIKLIPSLSPGQLERTLKYIAELLKEPNEEKEGDR